MLYNYLTLKLFILVMAAAIFSCGQGGAFDSKNTSFDVNYSFASEYVGSTTNLLTIELLSGEAENFQFLINSEVASISVENNTLLSMKSQEIIFTVVDEGVYSADFKVFRKTGEPLIHEVLTWEYSTEAPDEPVISFADTVTNSLNAHLLISDSRTSNTNAIWISGDVEMANQTEVDEGGYWVEIESSTFRLPIVLTSGDGEKIVRAKFRNIFGNESEEGVPATIILKQNPPTNCDVQLQSNKINSNKVSAEIFATDNFPVNYSVTGDVNALVVNKEFTSGDVEYIYLEQSEGIKDFRVIVQDIAGNICFNDVFTVEIDTSYEPEGLWVDGKTYWSDTEFVNLTAKFDFFPSQSPLQIRFTGGVSGSNANAWLDYQESIPISLYPSTSGSRMIFVQYKDANGAESYLISKRIFLKPEVLIANGLGSNDVITISRVLDATSISVSGCNEAYVNVSWQDSYDCEPTGGIVEVTYHFADNTTLVKSVAVP